MTTPNQHLSRPLAFLLTATLLALFLQPAAGHGEETTTVHEIALNFDMLHGGLSGTSRLELPAGQGITLDCGPLEVTAAVLDTPTAATLPLKLDADRRLSVAPLDKPQTLLLSWALASADQDSGNLISDQGITLTGVWHPLADRDLAFALSADLPPGFSAVSEGDQLRVEKTRLGRRLHASFPHPVAAINFVAGPYVEEKEKVREGLFLYSYFFKEDHALAADYRSRAKDYLLRYEKLLGPYPYTRFSIVENRLPSGYAMPGFTLLGQAVARLPFIKDSSLGHEVLHSWFGNSVFLAREGGNWCEGLTTLLADLAQAEDRGEGAQARKQTLQRYHAFVHPDNTMTAADFNGASGDYRPLDRAVRTVGYDKVAMVLHMLRRRLGDDDFFAGLRRFLADNRFRRAGWPELRRAFEQAGETELEGFFSQWLGRADTPELEVAGLAIREEQGKVQLNFELRQKNQTPYALRVPLRVRSGGGESRHEVLLEGPATSVRLELDELPIELRVDPEYDLMRQLARDEIAPTWARLQGSPTCQVLVGDQEDQVFGPLVLLLAEQGCARIAPAELKNQALGDRALVFAGPSTHSRALFAGPGHPAEGFTVDVRKNPLNEDQVAVLVSSSSLEQTAAALPKLRHYGKYAYLHFLEGHLQEKRLPVTDDGLIHDLLDEPKGMAVGAVQDFDAIVDQLMAARVIYVGETHTDHGDHLLQRRIIEAVHRRDPKLAIGMEMFPRDRDGVLADYVSGAIDSEREFLKQSDYFSVWGYDYRLYRDLIGLARRHRIPLIGLNLRKEIVSQVFRDGHLDGLEAEQSAKLPPDRDLDLPGYRRRLGQVHAMHGQNGGRQFSGFLQAQAIWDETMAESVVDYLRANPERRIIVLAGTGHVYGDSAIPPRVKRRLDVAQRVVLSGNSGEIGVTEGKRADFVFFTEEMELEPAGKIGVVLASDAPEEGAGRSGLRVEQLSPHGKAGAAGLEVGDFILAIDGEPVKDMDDLKIALFDKKAGDRVKLKVLRERLLLADEELEIEVELSNMERPPGHP